MNRSSTSSDPQAKFKEEAPKRAGIVEHGLFIGLATDLMVGGAGGVQHHTRKV